MSQIGELQALLQDFARRRDWEQFHTPKNLAMALAGEVGELVAELQWLTPDESTALAHTTGQLAAVTSEIADVAIYLLRLADVLGIDLERAVHDKISINEGRFPEAVPRSIR